MGGHQVESYILNLPREILLQVFDALCDLEFTADYRSVAIPQSSRARQLKPLLRPVSQVCLLWRELILCSPVSWITAILVFGRNTFRERVQEARIVLEHSQNSDIDIWFSFPPIRDLESEALALIGELLNHRREKIRSINASDFTPPALKQIQEQLMARSWPRLRSLKLESPDPWISDPGRINAPGLLSVLIQGPPFRDQFSSTLFKLLSTIQLRDYNWIRDPSVHADWSISLLRRSISFSASTLTVLHIHCALHSTEGEPLHGGLYLPCLVRLSLTFHLLAHLIQFVASIDCPLLSEISLSMGHDDGHQSPDTRQSLIKLLSVKRAVFRLAVCCYPKLLQRLDIVNVTDIAFVVFHYNANQALARPNSGQLPLITFPKLRNLHIDWQWRQSLNNHGQCSWFFTYFDFKSTSTHVDLSLNYAPPRERILFPNASKFTCQKFDDLNHVVMPSLRHLFLKTFRAAAIQRSAKKLHNIIYLPFANVEALELEAWILLPQFDYTELSQALPNVKKLIIQPPFFHLLEGPNQLSGDSLLRDLNCGSLFPKLHTIEVACADHVREIPRELINLLKDFISVRKEQRHPISNLHFDDRLLTGAKLSMSDRQWFQTHVDHVALFQVDDEFTWYRECSPLQT